MKKVMGIWVIILSIGLSCNRKVTSYQDKSMDLLILDSLNSIITDPSINNLESLKVEYYDDSITVISIYKNRIYENDYFMKGNALIEYRNKLFGGTCFVLQPR